MKLAVAIAGKNAPPSAFVVWRGFDESIPKAADYGYNGIELALKNAEEIDTQKLNRMLNKHDLEVSCITTGQVFAVLGLYFTNPDFEERRKAIAVFRGLIDLAKDFGQMVNIGRARGSIGAGQTREKAEKLFIDTIENVCDIAEKEGVTLVIEPATHKEINFINTLDECADLLKRIRNNNVGIMPDIYHMNIEDKDIEKSLIRNGELIRYIHFSDSNRLSPGQGDLDFNSIFNALMSIKYNDWISVEILPEPDPDIAAKRAADSLLPMIEKYNAQNKMYT